ncbi:SGNH/GDSL hydrolase family protein [Legionella sp. PATHC038]|uniref:SGNH/GDSL hydrolase family protein n=1 Tax=Legionella sheltonii TaxID=2992041 RepID=UPI0022445E66|nr:SGNH/GDSL hydrolase family protein [Legionella sp. PATHC038]MCW8400106.1 SGNH/GDSL hydrolase family protein [Legionella sp. PATHC038]
MGLTKNLSESIGAGYPKNTGRLKQVLGNSETPPIKAAFMGDSTLDNPHWVSGEPYAEKTHTVPHQTAEALARGTSNSYLIGNFAVDGATTDDLLSDCSLGKVLTDEDHIRSNSVHQLKAVTAWKPDVVVLSVGGNNYREALADTLMEEMNYPQLLLRITPENAKPAIHLAFEQVKANILKDYKQIIDELIDNNPQLSRIVLLSQYYPSITQLTPYFIYTGFSHLARAEGKGRAPFTVVEETMNALYREILAYVAAKDKEIVFVDTTSSLNPLGGKHALQIEPNEQGSEVMGRLIAGAIEYKFPGPKSEQAEPFIPRIYLSSDEKQIQTQILNKKDIEAFRVKTIGQFISENRYRHLRLLFSPSSSLTVRFESAYRAITGNQFDDEYTGLPAFGLLDLTLLPVMASYLWHVAVNENVHTSLRVIAGGVAAPILLGRTVLGLSLMLALSLPILGYDKAVHLITSPNTENQKEDTETNKLEV